MGAWGVKALESDDGLDMIGILTDEYLSKHSALNLDEILELMKREGMLGEDPSDIDFLYDNTAMALAELYLQWKDDGRLNYDTDKSIWCKVTDFTASKKALAFLLRLLTDIKNEVPDTDGTRESVELWKNEDSGEIDPAWLEHLNQLIGRLASEQAEVGQDMDILKQCQKWHEESKQHKIIDALEAIPAEERTPEMDSELARAYNNLADPHKPTCKEMLKKALALLKPHEEYFEDDYYWNFRMGYSYFYLDQEGRALRYFEKALEVRPGDDDTKEFIDRCKQGISLPQFWECFRERTENWWETFAEQEAELRRMMDEDKNLDLTRGAEIAAQMEEILNLVFDEISFEMGFNGEKYELILTPEGDKVKLFELVYFQRHAPKKVLEHWNILVGRKPIRNIGLRTDDGWDISGEDVQLWLEEQGKNSFAISAYCEKLLPLLREEEGRAWWMLTTLTDQVLGEIPHMRYIDSFDVLEEPKAEPSILMSHLPDELKERGLDLSTDPEAYLENYTGYQMKPKEDPDADWRLDVMVGSTCCVPLINGYMSADNDFIDELHADGVVAGFFCYPLDTLREEEGSQKIFDFRDKLEETLTAGDGPEMLTLIGGATGLYCGYVDFIAWDLRAALNRAKEFFEGTDIPWANFHTFRREAGTLSLKKAQDDEPDAGEPEDEMEETPTGMNCIPYTQQNAEAFFQQLEQWNDADEYTRCIEAIEAIPQEQWDYRMTFALVRALENYAIIGDHDQGTLKRKGDKALHRAIDLLESVREEGEGKAEWNMRMAYAYQYLYAQEEKAIPYARRWAELDPSDKKAGMVIQECQEEIEKRKQREKDLSEGLLRNIEQWNDADEYTKCIEAIQVIPERERGYQLTLLLGRAYSNLAVLGDHRERQGQDDDVDQDVLAHALEIFESIREEGQNDPYWYSRMANALYMTDGREAEALEYAKKWLALDPDNENAKQFVDDCVDYLRQEDRRELFAHLDLYDKADMDTIEAHIETHFGKFDWIMHETIPGEYVHLDICVIPPREDHNYYTLVTMGMGAYTMNTPEKDTARAELLINLPPDWKLGEDAWEDEHWFWPVGILKALARYPMLHDTWLGWGHTVYGSEDSYADNTKLCGTVLLSPGVFGDPASVCTLPNGEPVNFYQVIPLYREEVEFKREHDVDRLLEKFPDELLEVIDPARPNVITDAEAIAYDDALMDEAKTHLAIIQDKQLPVEELAAYNHMAIYLRWCMEHDLMSVPFLAAHKDVVEAVKGGQAPDLRVFLRDSEDLRGRLHLTWFDRKGTEFARWYSWGSKATPYNYNKDIAAHAKAYFGDERHGGEAYLFVPWDERYYQEMTEIISQRFAQWEALEENQEPKKKLCIRLEDIRPLLLDWNGPRGCFASDRVMVDGCKIGELYRLEPDRGDEGWDSGWNFLAGDENEEYCDDSRNFSIYDLNTLCNHDPDIIPLLGMPYGTWLERGEDGQFYEAEDESEDGEDTGGDGVELNTQKYPPIPYRKGEALFLSTEESGMPFLFDVSANLTGDDEAMAAVSSALDEAEALAEKAKAFVEGVLVDEASEYYGIVSYFMEFHRDDLPEDMVQALFPVDDPSALTLMEVADYLQLKRFGSFLDEETKGQMFIMDLTFNPEITNELLVIYFNADRQIVNISHES